MEFTSDHRTAVSNSDEHSNVKRRSYSIFEVSSNFLDSCRFIELLSTPELTTTTATAVTTKYTIEESGNRWSCNTCKSNFESLHDQRSHFKSDFHRLNIKLSIAGKDTVPEDEYDEWSSNPLVKDYDISSISGSEDEDDPESGRLNDLTTNKQKLFMHLPNGETISFWKCLLLGDTENILLEHDLSSSKKDDDTPFVTVKEVTQKLLNIIHEPRNNTHVRIMLLVSGGHFAGCVFDGNSVVSHKTFHRYVTRAKAGKNQSSQDAGGKIAHSAGASIRRHNELALQKDIRELLISWKPYIDLSACIFIHAPSHNRKLLFDGENPYFSCHKSVIRHIPLTVRRPTLKEAQRLYNILTQISTEPEEKTIPLIQEDSTRINGKESLISSFKNGNISENCYVKNMETIPIITLPLHEAAKAENPEKVLDLLEQGFDPCVLDERGRAPYMLATKKEVRNTFRRFMALNPNMWDWQAAKVPSPLTRQMEESQNAKQTKKDAKRKARAKELKLLRKAREKKAQDNGSQSDKGISSTVAGVLVLVIGSLILVAFGQKNRGR